ncbi:MAG: STAS domain-containing protein [Planctomycetes bacterium]|nr:STAS domain-containing protein [Planctomycetota bacterium]
MELRDAIKLAIDHLVEHQAPEEVAAHLTAAGYSAARAEGLSTTCLRACTLARDEVGLDLARLQEALTAGGARADTAALISLELLSERRPELRLGEREGVPVLQLLGDLDRLPPERLSAIREEILEPFMARDSRLLVDLGAMTDAPLEVFGILFSDIATLREAGGDLVVCGLDEETSELAEAYRLGAFVSLAKDPVVALARLARLSAKPAAGKRFVVLRGAAEGCGILALRGALDARSVERAERKVRKVLAKHSKLILDCKEVPWISPEGFAFLRRISAELGSSLRVARIVGPAGVAAERAKLSKAFSIYAGRREALESFPGASTTGEVEAIVSLEEGEEESEEKTKEPSSSEPEPVVSSESASVTPPAEPPEPAD